MTLCKTLLPIYELEIELGNIVKSIDSPVGTNCPYAVNFINRLHFNEINSRLNLSPSVERWANRDKHYLLQEGFYCSKYRHSVAGPL
jgi:hypothetical protein